jgi:hypothetical protein
MSQQPPARFAGGKASKKNKGVGAGGVVFAAGGNHPPTSAANEARGVHATALGPHPSAPILGDPAGLMPTAAATVVDQAKDVALAVAKRMSGTIQRMSGGICWHAQIPNFLQPVEEILSCSHF